MKMLKFKEFVNWLNEAVVDDSAYGEVIDFVKSISQKPVKSEGKTTQKFSIYLKNRDSEYQNIVNKLTEMGLDPKEVHMSGSSFPQTEFFVDGVKIRFLYKPTGGAAITTLNSTITELTPCILFSYGYKG